VPPCALGRDHGFDVDRRQLIPDRIAVVSLVADEGVDPIAQHAQERHEALRVVRLAGRQQEAEGTTLAVAAGVDLGREAAARAPEPLPILSPFFRPTAQ
jgi:hypothetical protein